ncbi:MAG TPA: hypothetical protein PKH97_09460 [Tetrasphaera sp.]|nr:hypothetical protein [Tetrasphaera sp.]
MATASRRGFPARCVRGSARQPGAQLLARAFSGAPEFGPTSQLTTATAIDGDVARVAATPTRSTGPRFLEYRLVRLDGDWRIAAIDGFHDDPDAAFMPAERASALTGSATADATLTAMPPHYARLDPARLFVERDIVDDDGDSTRIEVRPVGRFTVSSGVLAVVDFAYDASMIKALTRSVPPREYAADIAVAFERCAALRVTFGPDAPVAWHPATASDGGHVAGVDAGNLAVIGIGAYAAATVRGRRAPTRTSSSIPSHSPSSSDSARASRAVWSPARAGATAPIRRFGASTQRARRSNSSSTSACWCTR